MTRQLHTAPENPAQRHATSAGRRQPTRAEAVLALQRQAGNAAVSQLLTRRGMPALQRQPAVPGAWPDSDVEQDDQASPAGSPRPSLDSYAEQPVDVDQIPVPRPPSSVYETPDARIYETPRGSGRGTPASSVYETPDASIYETPPTSPRGSVHAPARERTLNGDLAKAAGAGAALAVPALGIANVAGQGAQLATAGIGVSSATAVGDAVSEVVKYLQTGSVNVPKLLGGIVTAGGLLTTMAGMAGGVDAVRYAGMGAQSAGLSLKSAGEGYRFEDGRVDLTAIPSGDIAKMAGAFVASAGPILQAVALDAQRRLEQQIREGGGTGAAPPTPMAVMAAVLAGGTAAGDFASEVVKGVRDGKVNVPKLMGGLLSMIGAATIAGGVATGNPAVRYAGLGLQEAGLAAKSAGEARKWESTRMGDVGGWPLLGRLRPARPEPRGDELV